MFLAAILIGVCLTGFGVVIGYRIGFRAGQLDQMECDDDSAGT